MSKRLIYAEDAIKALHDEIVRRRIDEDTNDDGALDEFDTEAILRRLPSAQPECKRECTPMYANVSDYISRQAAIDAQEAYMADHPLDGYEDELALIDILRNLPPAHPQDIARDIATIIENEKDMRVMLKNAQPERTETHTCVYQRTETHGVCLDAISRQMAIDEIDVWIEAFKENGHRESASDAHFIRGGIGALPPTQPEPISEEYAKAVRSWLINYQVRCAELMGRYTPYEILGWIVSDWRKENEIW